MIAPCPGVGRHREGKSDNPGELPRNESRDQHAGPRTGARVGQLVTEIVTLEVSETLAARAREVAVRTNRRVEDVLVEWLDRAAEEPPIEMLADDEVLTLCDLQMGPAQQEQLSDLLARHHEGQLDPSGHERLDALMDVYRHGLVRKAQALKVAVERGLRPPLQ